jgi:hypothetical protein
MFDVSSLVYISVSLAGLHFSVFSDRLVLISIPNFGRMHGFSPFLASSDDILGQH